MGFEKKLSSTNSKSSQKHTEEGGWEEKWKERRKGLLLSLPDLMGHLLGVGWRFGGGGRIENIRQI